MNIAAREKLIEIVATLLEIAAGDVDDATGPESLDRWDSLNHLNICAAVTQEFGITMTTDEMTAVRCVGDLARLLEQKGVS